MATPPPKRVIKDESPFPLRISSNDLPFRQNYVNQIIRAIHLLDQGFWKENKQLWMIMHTSKLHGLNNNLLPKLVKSIKNKDILSEIQSFMKGVSQHIVDEYKVFDDQEIKFQIDLLRSQTTYKRINTEKELWMEVLESDWFDVLEIIDSFLRLTIRWDELERKRIIDEELKLQEKRKGQLDSEYWEKFKPPLSEDPKVLTICVIILIMFFAGFSFRYDDLVVVVFALTSSLTISSSYYVHLSNTLIKNIESQESELNDLKTHFAEHEDENSVSNMIKVSELKSQRSSWKSWLSMKSGVKKIVLASCGLNSVQTGIAALVASVSSYNTLLASMVFCLTTVLIIFALLIFEIIQNNDLCDDCCMDCCWRIRRRFGHDRMIINDIFN